MCCTSIRLICIPYKYNVYNAYVLYYYYLYNYIGSNWLLCMVYHQGFIESNILYNIKGSHVCDLKSASVIWNWFADLEIDLIKPKA